MKQRGSGKGGKKLCAALGKGKQKEEEREREKESPQTPHTVRAVLSLLLLLSHVSVCFFALSFRFTLHTHTHSLSPFRSWHPYHHHHYLRQQRKSKENSLPAAAAAPFLSINAPVSACVCGVCCAFLEVLVVLRSDHSTHARTHTGTGIKDQPRQVQPE